MKTTVHGAPPLHYFDAHDEHDREVDEIIRVATKVAGFVVGVGVVLLAGAACLAVWGVIELVKAVSR